MKLPKHVYSVGTRPMTASQRTRCNWEYYTYDDLKVGCYVNVYGRSSSWPCGYVCGYARHYPRSDACCESMRTHIDAVRLPIGLAHIAGVCV